MIAVISVGSNIGARVGNLDRAHTRGGHQLELVIALRRGR